MTEVKLGKIRMIRMGDGGYQDACFGVTFDLGGKSWGVSDFKGTWNFPPDKHAKWTVEDQNKEFVKVMRLLSQLCKDADVRSIDQLKGVPVEVTIENQQLKSWRILTEVI